MDRIWQWAWDRHAKHYSWMLWLITFPVLTQIYAFTGWLVMTTENSTRYVALLGIVPLVVSIGLTIALPPRFTPLHVVERWASGEAIDASDALEASYRYARGASVRIVLSGAIGGGLVQCSSAAVAGAPSARLVTYSVLGAAVGAATQMVAVHSYVETSMRPLRIALTQGTSMGDDLPRSSPTFAAWSDVSVVCVGFIFTAAGSSTFAALAGREPRPDIILGVCIAMTIFFAVPITVGTAFAPSLRPIRDLADATERVANGIYDQRLPVVQDDDLGALAASFNRMQAGLAEGRRLHSAFGTYVDPTLAARLLEQGGDVFAGERREVTVMFIDIRDFTPFAEANTAEDTVAHLNTLFGIVVPEVVAAGGHVNKFLGDGAMVVFGAPNDLDDHAEAALGVAMRVQDLVEEQFDGKVRIGIGINTGTVIAGTIGGGSKLEFTLIGDAVNVAARVEQLTKTTADRILVTQDTLDALDQTPRRFTDRGDHAIKGKSAPVRVHAVA